MHFPIKDWSGEIPRGNHPGAFGVCRKYDIHTGVDLYVPGPEPVYIVEAGEVVSVENFTGPEANSPWWLPTKAILVEGPSGVICYGEVNDIQVKVGDKVKSGDKIATISPVLLPEMIRSNIPNHSRFMLHFELYETGTIQTVWWLLNQPQPPNLKNPTDLLQNALDNI